MRKSSKQSRSTQGSGGTAVVATARTTQTARGGAGKGAPARTAAVTSQVSDVNNRANPKFKVLSTPRNAGLKALVSQIAKTYGVKVAAEPKVVKNPYQMSAEDALAIARRVGLVTKDGKLAGIFK